MDLNTLDQRLRAFEKKARQFEHYFRSNGFRPWRRVIAGLALIAGLGAAGYYAYQYLSLSNARVSRVDDSLAQDFPSYESHYCRWLYGDTPPYEDCLRNEQKSYALFDAAWQRGKHIADVREQMIACHSGAQNENGISWHSAADCAELNNQDLPEAGKP